MKFKTKNLIVEAEQVPSGHYYTYPVDKKHSVENCSCIESHVFNLLFEPLEEENQETTRCPN